MKKKCLNVVWVEDVKISQKSIWFSLEPDLKKLGIELNITWQDSGRGVASLIHEKNCDRGRDGYNSVDIIDLLIVDYNLEETLEENQKVALNGLEVIVEVRQIDHEIPVLFYTGNSMADLNDLIAGENNVHCSHRDDINTNIIRLIQDYFI